MEADKELYLKGKILRINAPEWYTRTDFLKFLEGTDHPRPASWHQGGKPNSMSDIFIVVDGELSDQGLPDDIAEAIIIAWEDMHTDNFTFSYGIVWISNVTD